MTNPPDDRDASPARALADAVDRVGDRWTLRIVHALLEAPARFGDLERVVEGISPNVLSQRLKHLEHEGLVVATPYSQRPPRFTYELSATGTDLAGALRLLAQWGADHGSAAGHGLRHEPCGTPVEARWWCPTCDVTVAEDAADELDHL